MVQMNFNAAQYEPSTGAADVLETGVYSVQIVNSEVKQTKSGNGYMLVLTMSCMDQHVNGKKLTARLNIHNPNAQAVEIAYRELSAISHVVGVMNWQDTQQLHGRPFKVSVEKSERQDKPGSFSNDIKAYMDYAGNPPNVNGGGSSQAPSAPSAAPPAPAAAQAPASAPAYPPQAQYAPASAPAPAPAPAAAMAPAPTPAAAPAPAHAPAPAPQPTDANVAAPWQQPQQQAPAQAPWQNAAPAPAAGAPVPPWQAQ